ncbi:OmpA family protein [Haliea sp. E17]|uniref:OmpA family protein n=1 Tax=Haliea sp. E17 TaxID=3401576 RepID=UPI003AB081BF
MKKLIMAAGVACGIAASAFMQPAVADVPLTINAGYGYWSFDNDRGLDDDGTPWAGLEWAFNDTLAVELMGTYGSFDIEDTNGEVDLGSYQLGLMFYAGSYKGGPNRVRPYLTFGMAQTDMDSDDSDAYDDTESAAYMGAGLRYMITPAFGARFDARAVHGLDDDDTDILVSAGLNYYFGDTSEDVMGAGAATTVDGDEDGDGVPDSRDKCPGTPAGTRVDADGCPLPVTRVASIKMMVNFAFDSDVVQEQYFNDISELAAFLKRFDQVDVDIEGHTDSTGPDNYNMTLSQRRANAVVDVLVNKYGIDRSRLEPKGYGETQPVADNGTKEGRAENRRVMATLEVEYED